VARRRRRGASSAGRARPALLLGAAVAVAMLAALGARDLIVRSTAPVLGGPYSLTDAAGHRVTQADFRGRETLIYFGYTHCADVCPLTLANIAAALDRLGPRGRDIVPLFISVDPARDTPSAIAAYTARFSPRIVGLTAPMARLQPVLAEFRVTARAEPAAPGMAADMYPVDHSALLYLMDGDNRLLRVMAVDTDVATLTRTLGRTVDHAPRPG